MTSTSILGLINAYLAPLMLAVPIAVLLLLLGTRRGPEDDPVRPKRGVEGSRQDSPGSPPAAATPRFERAPDGARAPAAAAALAPPGAAAAATPAAGATVLIVDDSAVVRVKLRRLLEGAGHRVLEAADGEQALQRLAAEPVALLLTDLEMPRLDGFGLIAAVQGSLETEMLPIIAITGHEELQARVHDCQGLYGLFRKPWNDRQLLDRVNTLVALGRRSVPTPQPA